MTPTGVKRIIPIYNGAGGDSMKAISWIRLTFMFMSGYLFWEFIAKILGFGSIDISFVLVLAIGFAIIGWKL